jgi:hypothetical protein
MIRVAVKNRDSERQTDVGAELFPNGVAFCIHPVKKVGRYVHCTLQRGAVVSVWMTIFFAPGFYGMLHLDTCRAAGRQKCKSRRGGQRGWVNADRQGEK